MQESKLPSVVQGRADKALLNTAETWSFEAGDSIEAVITKIVRRTPLTFTNPSLGLLIRCAAPEAYPVIVKSTWNQAKQKRKKQVGSSGYISEVTGEISSVTEDTARLSEHYQTRKDECCPLRNTNTDQTIRGTVSELEELIAIEQVLRATTVGIADTRDDVMDEAGDTFYAAFCYTVAWKEQTSQSIRAWRANMGESDTQPLTEREAQSTQTLADHTSCRTNSPAIEQRMNEMSSTMLEKMKSNTANGINCEVTMAGVKETMEEISVVLDMKAGDSMTLATEIFRALNHTGMQQRHKDTVITEATARKQRVINSTAMNIAGLIDLGSNPEEPELRSST